MTFYGDPLETPFFYVYVFLGCYMVLLNFICLYFAIHLKDCALFISPLTCLCMALENIIMSMGNLVIKYTVLRKFALSCHALILPCFLYLLFETSYLVHKNRSVRFCGIYFDEGHRLNTEPCSWFLRNVIRIIAFFLAVVEFIVDFDLVKSPEDNAGRVGYLGLEHNATSHVVLSLLAPTILSFVAMYLGIQFWRYGSHSAMRVHATHCNDWACMFVGAVCLFIGQFPPGEWYPLTSNISEAILMTCLVLSFRAIRKDFIIAESFMDFLERQNHPSSSLNQTAKATAKITTSTTTTSHKINITSSNESSNNNNSGISSRLKKRSSISTASSGIQQGNLGEVDSGLIGGQGIELTNNSSSANSRAPENSIDNNANDDSDAVVTYTQGVTNNSGTSSKKEGNTNSNNGVIRLDDIRVNERGIVLKQEKDSHDKIDL